MTACARHRQDPVQGYRECPGCEIEALQAEAQAVTIRAENAEAALSQAETELARVRETLSDLYHQHKCGCGHPACRSCGRDRGVEAALGGGK